MNWHDSGGAAFQIPHSNEPHAPCAEHGMTLRDWFAGKALVGVIDACKADTREPGETAGEMFARKSFAVADAMLAARAAYASAARASASSAARAAAHAALRQNLIAALNSA
jgi:hypothetical protein